MKAQKKSTNTITLLLSFLCLLGASLEGHSALTDNAPKPSINAPLIASQATPDQNKKISHYTPIHRDRLFLSVFIISLFILGIIITSLLYRIKKNKKNVRRILAINQHLEEKVQQRTQALEEATKESERLLRLRNSILDNSLVSIVLLKERQIEWMNHYAELMFGYTNDEVIGRRSDFIYDHIKDFEHLGTSAPPILSSGGTYQHEYAFKRKNGTVLWGLINGKALNPKNLSEGVLFVIMDISSRKESEDQLKELNTLLEKQATTDYLTGVKSRRYGAEKITDEVHRFNRYQSEFSIILMDVDHFKRINDHHGHTAGDMVLIEIANLMKQSCRNVDTIIRWGGEEFLIICPATCCEDASKLAELLRARIEGFNFGFSDSITASFGVACHNKNQSQEALIKTADQALYLAKESRNTVKSISKH